MFILQYKIPKEVKAVLKCWSVQDFEEEIAEIEGQIKLDFNGVKYGYIDEEDNVFHNKFLICWFKRLKECCKLLLTSKYVAFSIPETNDLWVEMKVLEDKIFIQRTRLFRNILTSYVVDSPYEDFERFDWNDVVIKKDEFINEIEKVTEEFINEIRELNVDLLDSEVFRELMENT